MLPKSVGVSESWQTRPPRLQPHVKTQRTSRSGFELRRRGAPQARLVATLKPARRLMPRGRFLPRRTLRYRRFGRSCSCFKLSLHRGSATQRPSVREQSKRARYRRGMMLC